MKKLDYSQDFIKYFKDFLKIAREYEKKNNPENVFTFYEGLASELKIMKLISFQEVREKW